MPLSFARVACLVALLSLAACSTTPPRTAPEESPALLLISIDGLRPDYLGKGNTPHLDRLAREGVHAEWMNPSYPVLTFPNHFTLVTGLRPDHHGIVHNSMRDEVIGRFRVADLQAGADARWWQGEPIWNTAEKAGLRTAVWAWPGNMAPIGGLRPARHVEYSPQVSPAARADEVAGWLTEPATTRPRLAALYIEQVDGTGHDHGPNAPQTQARVHEVDAAIGRMLETLESTGRRAHTNVVVVSDHGMAEVQADQYIALEDMASFEQAEAVSTGQVIGFNPRAGYETVASQRLLGRHAHYECWRKQELPARWQYGQHPRVPAIVCQMDEGWNALPAQQLQSYKAELNRGSHGYDPSLASMRATFIAAGPSFRAGSSLPAFDNVDVYPLLAHLLNIAPAPNDGSLDTFTPVLKPASKPQH